MTVNDIRKSIFENYCKWIDVTKKIAIIYWKKRERKYLVLNATNLTKKLLQPAKTKEHWFTFNKQPSQNSQSQKTQTTATYKICYFWIS